jgi:hypothetical protein
LVIFEESFLGQIAKTLFGSNANPSLTEAQADLADFAVIATGLKWAALVAVVQKT